MTSENNFLTKTRNLLALTSIALAYIFIPQISNAQVNMLDLSMPSASSKGSRITGGTVDLRSYKNLQRIRSMINKGDNEKASSRLIRIIRQEESKRNDGLKSDLLAVAYNELCLSSTNMRKVEYAMEVCNTSISMTPNHWESLKNRATLHFMTQNFPASLDDFKKSLENAPDKKELTDVLKQNIAVVENKIVANN